MVKGICVFVNNQIKHSSSKLAHCTNIYKHRSKKELRGEKSFVSLKIIKVLAPTSLFQDSVYAHGGMYTLIWGKECIIYEESMFTCINIVAHI